MNAKIPADYRYFRDCGLPAVRALAATRIVRYRDIPAESPAGRFVARIVRIATPAEFAEIRVRFGV